MTIASLVLDRPRSKEGAIFILAHGAGGSKEDPLLVELGAALVRRGHGIARFDFRYREEGRKLPDRAPVLEATYRDVLAAVRRSFRTPRKFIAGGKSMGGRMASHLAAAGDRLDGLLLLGYPLHPPEREDKLRAAHLPSIQVPTLFLTGTRDELCNLKLLRRSIAPMGERAELRVIQGGDHSLALLARSGVKRADHIERLADEVHAWQERAVSLSSTFRK